MGRKLALLALAVAAIVALALPGAASASPQLTEGFTPLTKGTTFALTSPNFVATKTAFGTVECGHVEFIASLDENSGTSIKAHGVSGTAAPCAIEQFLVIVTKPTLVSLATTGKNEGTLTLSFVLDVGFVECPYEGTGTFKYVVGSDVLTVPSMTLSSLPCGGEAEETPSFHGGFTMRTVGGGASLIVR